MGTPAFSIFSRGVAQGGDGFALYSVKARCVVLGIDGGVSGV